jgi:hypothetical protein
MNELYVEHLKSQFKDRKLRGDGGMTEEEYRMNRQLIEDMEKNPEKYSSKGFML